MQLTQTQKEKLRKILEVQEFGDMALLKLLVNLEEKVEEIPVNTQKDLEELRILLQKGRQTTLKEKQKVAELTAKLLTKEEVAEEVLKRISLEEIAKKVQVPKPKDGKDAVVDYSLLKKWITDNTPEIDIEEIKREVKEELQEMIPTVPEVVDNIPIVGEKVRDALELIYEEDEKLKMSAIGKLPETLKELETKIKKGNARGGGIAGINRIAEDGSIKWTGTGIINFEGFDVTATSHGVNVEVATTTNVITVKAQPTFTYSSGVLSNIAYSNGTTKAITYNIDGTLNTLTTVYTDLTTITKTMNWVAGQLISISVV
jgi:hypothetical protein